MLGKPVRYNLEIVYMTDAGDSILETTVDEDTLDGIKDSMLDRDMDFLIFTSDDGEPVILPRLRIMSITGEKA